MKANAPEKIYVEICHPFGNEFTEMLGFEHKGNSDDIEYIRTDAFIEKACVWLRTHSEDDYFELIQDANYCGAGNINKKRMIDEFRKYMKGE